MSTEAEPTDDRHADREEVSADGSAEHRCRSEVELLLEEGATPETYALQLITRNDGRVRQKTLVAESGLSESTVSRLLSEMESEGQIRRRRIGRENIVYLPGSEPAGFEDPMDEPRGN